MKLRYEATRYSKFWYGIINNEEHLYMRKPSGKLLLFKTKDEAEKKAELFNDLNSYIERNLEK